MERGDRTKASLIASTADLIQRQGFGTTGMKQILETSGASRGSLYFHFPGGKEELVIEALKEATRRWRGALQAIMLEQESAGEMLEAACALLGERLRRSGWHKGCPVATITLEMGSANEEIRQICEEHFRLWTRFLHDVMARSMPEAEAEAWATLALTSIEGALLLSRAYQDTGPLMQVGRHLSMMVNGPAREGADLVS